MKTVKCVNAREMSRQHPNTFHYPEDRIPFLEVGHFVKICTEEPAERFWVRVTNITGDVVKGVIDNKLVFSAKHGLYFRDEIVFKTIHIYDIQS